MCDWKACTTPTNGLPNPNEDMPRTRMSWVPRSSYICPTRLAVFLLGRKDLSALGALRIDDNQAFTTANRTLIAADELLASHTLEVKDQGHLQEFAAHKARAFVSKICAAVGSMWLAEFGAAWAEFKMCWMKFLRCVQTFRGWREACRQDCCSEWNAPVPILP